MVKKIDSQIMVLVIVTLILVIGFFLISFYIVNRDRIKKGEEKYTLVQFLNKNQKLDFKTVLVGMSFGIVFGFIDNAGLWFGLQSFQKYIPGGLLTKSGWGNTFSDGLGASLGTSVAIILRTLYPIKESPIWVDTIGIIIGCILGIYIPRLLTGKK
jgi:hypothetical protein